MKDLQRELRRGTLELVLLRLLADEPTYGYELVKRLRHGGGGFEVQEGTLYPILYRLEDAGWIEPEWSQLDPEAARSRGVPRKVYRLTAAGIDRLAELTRAWCDFVASVEAVLSSPTRREENR